ncbi:MAG: cobalamin-binding protein [Alphaproteobacteria bacterium]|nr:cobalamin-binding protein [Alphaproteobacteria bacterium]
MGEKADLIDAIGRRHVPARDARIVSLVPSLTELLFDLDLGSKVVGRTGYCIHPSPSVRRVKSLGGPKRINLRKLAALEPTHVILNIDENPKAIAEQIAEMGITVVVTHPMAPEDNYDLYRLFGGLFGREREAASLASRLVAARQSLRELALTLPPKRVLLLIWTKPWMTVSSDTYVSRMLATVNWRTMADDPQRRYPSVQIDKRVAAEADLILFATEPFPFQERHLAAFADRFPEASGKIHLISGEMLSWYGSRAVSALDYLGGFATRLASPAA